MPMQAVWCCGRQASSVLWETGKQCVVVGDRHAVNIQLHTVHSYVCMSAYMNGINSKLLISCNRHTATDTCLQWSFASAYAVAAQGYMVWTDFPDSVVPKYYANEISPF